MRIALVNGSPKVKDSASGILLQRLKPYLVGEGREKAPEKTETSDRLAAEASKKEAADTETGEQVRQIRVAEISLRGMTVSKETVKELYNADAWVVACPLYVDCLPAHLLSCLAELEQCGREYNGKCAGREICVYGIVNCGFYEGVQAEPALHVMQNWCSKSGFVWGGGIGVGGGGALGMMTDVPDGKGPMTSIDRQLKAMAERVTERGIQDNCYTSVAFPRFMYRAAAQMGWRQGIRANGGKPKDLGRRL